MKSKPYCVVRQQDQRDCGAACLLSVTGFYGGKGNLELVRRSAGTSVNGTTLLGLKQAAGEAGFDTEACRTNLEGLLEFGAPCILHVVTAEQMPHFVVFYGAEGKGSGGAGGTGRENYLIGDPARGLYSLDKPELELLWFTGVCLFLRPNSHFRTVAAIRKEKIIWIRGMVKKDESILAVAAFLAVLMAGLSLTLAIFSQRLVDDILPKKDFRALYIGSGLVILLLLIKEGLAVLRQLFLLRQSKDFNIRITGYFFSRLLDLPKVFFDSRETGELTARLNDTGRIQKVIGQLVGGTAIDAFLTLVSIGFIFTYSYRIAIGCLGATPFYYLLIYRHNKGLIEGQRKIMVAYAHVESNYISTIRGIEPIKNYNKQSLFSAMNKAIYSRFQAAIVDLGSLQVKLSFLANGFGAIFLAGVVLFSGRLVLENGLKAGALVAIVTMCSTLLTSVANLALVAIPISEAKIAFDRMFEFTGMNAEGREATRRLAGFREEVSGGGREEVGGGFRELVIRDLSFRFPGRSAILKGVSLTISKGEIIAIMGENGCGKSTLTRIIQQHYPPESGSILVNRDHALADIATEDWRRLIGVVPQQIHIFNASVLENIAFDDAEKRTAEVLEFLEQYGFMSFVQGLPQSYMTRLGEEGIKLSGGQQQLIAVARALYQRPQLLILDEATAAMDREREQFVLGLLQSLKSRMGIVIISHRLHVLKSICDRIYILEGGRIAASGSHKELVRGDNLYSKYWADLV
jgi:ABC-type bacteriocin/lantibiotic exporter with double-glycine peptidase domain